jgi:hypothetical protein
MTADDRNPGQERECFEQMWYVKNMNLYTNPVLLTHNLFHDTQYSIFSEGGI